MPLFKVQRGSEAIGILGSTRTIDDVGSLNDAFEMALCNRMTQGGPPLFPITVEVDDMCGVTELTATDTLTFTRVPGSVNSTVTFKWGVVEYQGTASGSSEFVVRSRNYVVMGAGTTTATRTISTTPTNIDRCIPIITGIVSNITTAGGDNATAIAWCSGTNTLNIERGGDDGTTAIQIVVVEFTGSDWTVLHGDSGSVTADTGTINLTTDGDGVGAAAGVGNWSTAAIFGQMRGDPSGGPNDAIADLWPLFKPGADDEKVDWAFHSDHDASDNRLFVHVLQHDEMVVTRFTDTGSHQGARNVNVQSAGLTNLASAFTIVQRTTSGTGTAYGRGWVTAHLTGLTNCELWVHRSGNTIETNIQVIDLLPIGRVSGTGAGSFSALAGAGVGVLAFPGQGGGAFRELEGAGAALLLFPGSGAGVFVPFEGAGAALLLFPGTGAGAFPDLEGAGAGSLEFPGSGAGELPLLEGAGAGELRFAGSGAGTLPGLRGTGVGEVIFVASGAGEFADLEGAGAGLLEFPAAGAGAFRRLEGAGAGLLEFAGSGAGAFRLLEGAGVGFIEGVGVVVFSRELVVCDSSKALAIEAAVADLTSAARAGALEARDLTRDLAVSARSSDLAVGGSTDLTVAGS